MPNTEHDRSLLIEISLLCSNVTLLLICCKLLLHGFHRFPAKYWYLWAKISHEAYDELHQLYAEAEESQVVEEPAKLFCNFL